MMGLLRALAVVGLLVVVEARVLTTLADLALAGFRVSRAYLSAVDHDAKLDSPVRVGTSSERFGSAKLIAEDILKNRVRRMERY